MGDFQRLFSDLLDPEASLSLMRVAKDLGRYHYYRMHNGMGHDQDILAALGQRGFRSGESLQKQDLSALSSSERMICQLIAAIMECLKDGREFHSAMLCGLTACAQKD